MQRSAILCERPDKMEYPPTMREDTLTRGMEIIGDYKVGLGRSTGLARSTIKARWRFAGGLTREWAIHGIGGVARSTRLHDQQSV
jgi:hypothetical protein